MPASFHLQRDTSYRSWYSQAGPRGATRPDNQSITGHRPLCSPPHGAQLTLAPPPNLRKRTRSPRPGHSVRAFPAGMRRFMPGGGGEPSSSSSDRRRRHGEGGDDRAAGGGLRYGGGDISLGHGHPQLGAGAGNEDRQQDGSMGMLARHSSSPAGLFSNLVMDNGELATYG
jgi:hypothetical protein